MQIKTKHNIISEVEKLKQLIQFHESKGQYEMCHFLKQRLSIKEKIYAENNRN